MPELPEVQTIATELNRKLKKRIIKSVVVNAPKMVGIGPTVLPPKRLEDGNKVKKFAKLLQGKKIISVKRRAKLLIFNLSEGLLVLVHLKMTGQFIFEDQTLRKKTQGRYRIINKSDAPLVALPCKHTHVIFTFKDGSRLFFNDVRKFGYLKIVRHDEINQVKELQEFGPEPLDKNFMFLHFCAARAKV